jgi:hypothetical protein
MSLGALKFIRSELDGSFSAATAAGITVASGKVVVDATGGAATILCRSAEVRNEVAFAVVGEFVKSGPNSAVRFFGADPPQR